MSDKINMDKLVSDKFENFSVEPPVHIWANIQGQMAAKRRKVRMIYAGWISVAAIVIFAFVAGWMLNERNGTVSKGILNQQTSVQPAQRPNEGAAKEQSTDAKEVGSGETDVKNEPKTISEKHKTMPTSLLVAENEITKEEEKSGLTEKVERVSFRLLKGIRGFVEADEEIAVALRNRITSHKEKSSEVNEINEADRVLIAANAKELNEKYHTESTWVIGANVSPGYASHKASHSSEYARDLNYNSDEGAGNVGGGLSVQYKTNSRLSLETGVYYSKNGMKSGSGSSDRLYAASPSFDYTTGQSEKVSGEGIFTNAVELRQGDIVMNTTAGVVNITNTPSSVFFASSNTFESGEYSSVITANGRFSQNFDFVEIPLYLRYNVYDKKIAIDFMGGINAGLVVGNNAYIESNGSRQRIGSTEDISTLNISGTVGVGLGYAISKHVSLALEPRFNYYLNSINTNPDVVFKPYRLGLYTGVYYQF